MTDVDWLDVLRFALADEDFVAHILGVAGSETKSTLGLKDLDDLGDMPLGDFVMCYFRWAQRNEGQDRTNCTR